MVDITMPQLGETVTEGTITRWAKSVGDRIEIDEVLFEVSTDKVDSEVPSAAAGYVSEILVPEGDTVDVGTRLAVIGDAPADGARPTPAAQAAPPAPAASVAPAAPAASVAPAAPAAPVGEGLVLSPVVRRLIAEHKLDPSRIRGTGAGGRITRDDVLALIDTERAGTVPSAPSAVGAPPKVAPPEVQPGEVAPPRAARRATQTEEVLPFSKIRRITAEHMVRSKATSAHTGVVVEVDYAGIERVRLAERDEFKATEGISLTYLAFIARAVIDALEEFPHVNASVGDDQLIVHNYVNLAIAVDLNFEGLLAPVIHDADSQRLRPLARAIADVAARARTKRLTVDDLAGGTFTLTNAGPWGTYLTIPVINQPQVAILSTDGVRKRPVAIELPDGTDAVAVHPVGLLALSFDHRAFDGAYAAAFLARVKEVLETRDWAQEL